MKTLLFENGYGRSPVRIEALVRVSCLLGSSNLCYRLWTYLSDLSIGGVTVCASVFSPYILNPISTQPHRSLALASNTHL